MSLIPLVSFLIFFGIFWSRERCWRSAYLSAAISWGCLLTAITEILSFFSLIAPRFLLEAWIFSSISLLIYYLLINPKIAISSLKKLTTQQTFTIFSTVGCSLLLLGSGLVALISPPNNWDSMTYHMSRVANWIQDRNVAHYETHILRQLDQPPWSGFAIMHLQILSGGDRFANLVQWFSLLGCLIGISLIAKHLGAKPSGQVLSSVVCATIPMALLQSSSTQNDLVVSFWLVCLTHNILIAIKGNQPIQLSNAFGIGACFGLAILTKGTAYIYGLALLVWPLLNLAPRCNWQLLKAFGLTLITIFTININHWLRNWSFFGDILGPSSAITKNQLFTISAVISNLIRNLSLHIALPNQDFNHTIENLIIRFHTLLGLGVNDPRTTFLTTQFHVPPINLDSTKILLHEDISGNPFHLLLIFLCIALFCIHKRLHSKLLTSYLITLIGAFLCFNLLIAWQPWASRLHLPLFILFSAFIGTVLAQCFNLSILRYFIVTILLTLAVPYIFFNATRPLVYENNHFTFIASDNILKTARIEQYFNSKPAIKASYFKISNLIKDKGCQRIGLYTSADSWEYPLWVLINEKSQLLNQPKVKLRSVDLTTKNLLQKGKRRSSRNFIPCAIVSIDTDLNKESFNLEFDQATSQKSVNYFKALLVEPVGIYLRRSFETKKEEKQTT